MQSIGAQIKTLFLDRSDAVLVIGVLVIVGMLVIPLPTWMLDGLIAINIACAALVLLMALYVPSATRFAAFPSILLLTTLFRLSLNVSSTRLILLEAEAGNVIGAFGDFVVGGNFVVGGIVFLILVLIQFIVIAKGSERVAEVAARFTLDAMPGKQMSIDADLRAGLITAEHAKARRRAIEQESQLYGAMDGAMKFVKGDAIAGIVITVINIIGGLIVGHLKFDFSLAESAERFSLLTIGDGLVSQIPALLLSTSAGLVVTRVASAGDQQDEHVAKSILEQILDQPRAVGFCSLLLFACAFIPGFPSLIFLGLGVLVFGCWAALYFSRRSDHAVDESVEMEGESTHQGQDGDAPSQLTSDTHRINLEIHESLASHNQDEEESVATNLDVALNDRLERLGHRMGLAYPQVRISRKPNGLPENSYRLFINDTLVDMANLDPQRQLVLVSEKKLRSVGIRSQFLRIPWNHAPGALIADAQVEQARLGGFNPLGAREILLRQVTQVVCRYSREFVGLQETENLLNQLRQTHAIVVQQVTPKPISLQLLTETLQRLLAEAVPVREFRAILESMAKWGRRLQQPTAQELADLVRQDLRRHISAHYAIDRSNLSYFQIGAQFMTLIEESVRQSPRGYEIACAPGDRDRAIGAIRNALDTMPHSAAFPVLICDDQFRSLIREFIAWDFPNLAVMCWSELASEIQQQCIGIIDLVDSNRSDKALATETVTSPDERSIEAA